MSVADPLVLSPDVMLIRVRDLPAPVRDQIGDETGYAITQTRGRAASTLIDDRGAQLLREFASPSTIVDAVIRYSRRSSLDAERVLEEAFPVLRRCLDHGYLVEAGSARSQPQAVAFTIGEQVAGGTVLRCVQTLEDSEIYQLALDSGGLAALKVLRPIRSELGEGAFRREAEVLRHLDGRIAPRLLAADATAESPWLALEWCEGVPVSTAAAALRRSAGATHQLLDLCCLVADAYAQLHKRGVVHGDVHPGNVIVSPEGAVRVVDFGLARLINGHSGPGAPPRGGAPTFLAPDHAEAVLHRRQPGPATPLSDQFSLGALLYELLTGSGYVDFAIDDREMLRQIARDAPLPFTRRGRASWPEVEEALSAALAKDPSGRLPSVAELGRRLSAASTRSGHGVRAGAGLVVGVDALLESVLGKARPGGAWFEGGLPTAPLCSIAYGTAGLAVAIYRVGVLRDDPDLVALADEWAVRATWEACGSGAFVNAELELTDEITGRVTPFHRLSGVHAVQALVSHSVGDIVARQQALNSFVRESRHPCDNIDLALGRTGTLLGASILQEAIDGARYVDMTDVVTLGNETLSNLWSQIDAMPPVAEGTELRYLGIAHGWAGLLLATLRWCDAAAVAKPPTLLERLDQLAGLAQPAGAGLRWPWTNEGASAMPGWCNGSAGYVHLWTAAHAAFGDERWAVLAERAAWDTYTTSGIAQLCCGLAGQAYALLEMHRHTGERRWLTAAAELSIAAAAGVDAGKADGCVSGSLHKGEVGVALLAADLARPEAAAMPFFGFQG